jgi:hypothetical protein
MTFMEEAFFRNRHEKYLIIYARAPSFWRAWSHLLLASIFRVIVNRYRVYPSLAGLPAVFLVRRLYGGVAGWPADHFLAA